MHVSSSFRYDQMSAFDLHFRRSGLGEPRSRAPQPALLHPRNRRHRRPRRLRRALGPVRALSLQLKGERPVFFPKREKGVAPICGLASRGHPLKLASYWHDTAVPFANGTPDPVDGRVDVAVVGGGFTGLSAALALAKRGASVAVLEADYVGAGASGRNGGQCNNGFAQDFAAMEARFGFDRAVAPLPCFRHRRRHGGADHRRGGHRLRLRPRKGKLKLAAKPEHYDKLARARDALHPRCRSGR